MLGAVLALREALVTSDVPLLASVAALARLGVAKELVSTPHMAGQRIIADEPSSGRTTAGASHCSQRVGGTGELCLQSQVSVVITV